MGKRNKLWTTTSLIRTIRLSGKSVWNAGGKMQVRIPLCSFDQGLAPCVSIEVRSAIRSPDLDRFIRHFACNSDFHIYLPVIIPTVTVVQGHFRDEYFLAILKASPSGCGSPVFFCSAVNNPGIGNGKPACGCATAQLRFSSIIARQSKKAKSVPAGKSADGICLEQDQVNHYN